MAHPTFFPALISPWQRAVKQSSRPPVPAANRLFTISCSRNNSLYQQLILLLFFHICSVILHDCCLHFTLFSDISFDIHSSRGGQKAQCDLPSVSVTSTHAKTLSGPCVTSCTLVKCRLLSLSPSCVLSLSKHVCSSLILFSRQVAKKKSTSGCKHMAKYKSKVSEVCLLKEIRHALQSAPAGGECSVTQPTHTPTPTLSTDGGSSRCSR